MHYWTEYAIRRIPESVSTALDVGIGHCEPAMQFALMRKIDSLKGVEAFEEYTKRRLAKIYDGFFVGDCLDVLPTLPDKSFDVVMAFFVVEHLTRDRALRLIDELERVGKFIIITSHNVFFPGSAVDGNDLQRHRCVVQSWEMRKRGYKTRGLDFCRFPPVWTFTRLLPHINVDWLAWKETL